MEYFQVFFFIGLALLFSSIFLAFTLNLASMMTGVARRNLGIILKCLAFIFLFALVVASLVTRVIFLLRE
jgi:hypothetical protein